MEHSQVMGPTTSASAHKAFALLCGVLQLLLCSLKFLAFLFKVGFSFSCWVCRPRLAHSINCADLSFHFGLLVGFMGGSLVLGALFTPTFTYCFATLLLVQSYIWLNYDLAFDCFGPVTASASIQEVTPDITQDVFPAICLQAIPKTSVMHVHGAIPDVLRTSYLSYTMMCHLILPYLDA